MSALNTEIWTIFGPMYKFFAVIFAIIYLLDHVGRATPFWINTIGVLSGIGFLLIAALQTGMCWYWRKHTRKEPSSTG